MLSHAMQCVYIFVFCDVKKIISIVFYSSLRANSPALNGVIKKLFVLNLNSMNIDEGVFIYVY